MIQLASKSLCTGCGACAYKCPKSCIAMRENEYGVIYPHLDSTNCIECHACEKVCPVLNPPSLNAPKKAYAAWSNDPEERRTSASGGIAIELHRHAIRNGYKAVGASQNSDFSVTHKFADNEDELRPFKNSKYVFSDAYEVIPKINDELKRGGKVVFIGLPCQVAAFRKIFKDNENLLLVDVVCHGSTPLIYLKQHISHLEEAIGKESSRMSFRDPEKQTYTYTFTLYSKKGKCIYAKRTKDGDTYQYGYHHSISYRENCYHCLYAKRNRTSDLTLCDYSGLGKMSPCDYTHRKVSCILCNTEKGIDFVDRLIEAGAIHADMRPLEEPIAGDPRLREYTPKSKARKDFERFIIAYDNDFEKSMAKVIKRDTTRLKIKKLTGTPRRIAKKIKRLVFK